MNNEYGISVNKWQQQTGTTEGAPDFAMAKAQLEKGDFSFVPIIEYWANKELPEAERLYGECALFGKGIPMDIGKAGFYLLEAAKNGANDAYMGLSEMEKMKGDIPKSKYWLAEGMNHGSLRCARPLVEYLKGGTESYDLLMYYPTLTKYITLETDRFEKSNAEAERSQVLENLKAVVRKAAENPGENEHNIDYEGDINKILTLAIPQGHREALTKALAEYTESKNRAGQEAKNKAVTSKVLKILIFVIPAFISIICYYKIEWGSGFFLTLIYWSIPVAGVGMIWDIIKSQNKDAHAMEKSDTFTGALITGAFCTIPMLAVLVIMGAFEIDSFIWIAIPQFIILEIQAAMIQSALK